MWPRQQGAAPWIMELQFPKSFEQILGGILQSEDGNMTRTRKERRLRGGLSSSPRSALNRVHCRTEFIFICIKLHQGRVSKRSQRRYEFWALVHPSSLTNTPVSGLNLWPRCRGDGDEGRSHRLHNSPALITTILNALHL